MGVTQASRACTGSPLLSARASTRNACGPAVSATRRRTLASPSVVGTTFSRLGKTMSPWPPHQAMLPMLRPSIQNLPVAPSTCRLIS